MIFTYKTNKYKLFQNTQASTVTKKFIENPCTFWNLMPFDHEDNNCICFLLHTNSKSLSLISSPTSSKSNCSRSSSVGTDAALLLVPRTTTSNITIFLMVLSNTRNDELSSGRPTYIHYTRFTPLSEGFILFFLNDNSMNIYNSKTIHKKITPNLPNVDLILYQINIK